MAPSEPLKFHDFRTHFMNVVSTELPGVIVLEPKVFGDSRGTFMETWQRKRYADLGMPTDWVQDNVSRSARGVMRGLHYQLPQPQGKLVHVLDGEVLDVAVDIRVGSPSFGRAVVVALSAENRRQIYVPAGFAHGFLVTGDRATVAYKCTDYYRPEFERGVRWNDPRLGIEWPVTDAVLSSKDAALPLLADVPEELLPRYQADV